MRDYWDRGMMTFSIPAHNGGRGPAPEFTKWAGMDAARCDLPTSHGIDTRNRAWQGQKDPQGLSGAKDRSGAFRRRGRVERDVVLDQRVVDERPRRDHGRYRSRRHAG